MRRMAVCLGFLLPVVSEAQNVGIGTTTPAESLSIQAGNVLLSNSSKGIMLNAADRPLITRGFDPFTSGPNTGVGRWGLFQEPFNLTLGIADISGRALRVAKYATDGTSTPLLHVGSNGNIGIGTVFPTDRFTIDSGDIRLWDSDKGILLNAVDRPLITRGFDPFSSGPNTGVGRWGLFQEPFTLTLGIADIPGRALQVAKYAPGGTASSLLHVGSSGDVGIGTSTPNTTLHVANGTTAALTSGTGYFLLGNTSGANLVMDNNGIQGRNSGVANYLMLNELGGHIVMGLTGSGNVGIRTTLPEERLTIASGNVKLNSSDKGIMLNGADRPFITRGFDPFTSGIYTGLGRWGIFMENSRLTFGIPNIANRAFEFSTYEANSDVTPVLTIDRIGQVKRPATNNIDLLPIAFGTINYQGGIPVILRSTGNFTVTRSGVGKYHITITNYPFSFQFYTVHVTPYNSDPDNFTIVPNLGADGNGTLNIVFKLSSAVYTDPPFSFIVYKIF